MSKTILSILIAGAFISCEAPTKKFMPKQGYVLAGSINPKYAKMLLAAYEQKSKSVQIEVEYPNYRFWVPSHDEKLLRIILDGWNDPRTKGGLWLPVE
jgi:hypothetical protein